MSLKIESNLEWNPQGPTWKPQCNSMDAAGKLENTIGKAQGNHLRPMGKLLGTAGTAGKPQGDRRETLRKP